MQKNNFPKTVFHGLFKEESILIGFEYKVHQVYLSIVQANTFKLSFN